MSDENSDDNVLGIEQQIKLLKLLDSLLNSDGGIYIDTAVYEGADGEDDNIPERSEDFVIIGSSDRKITIKDILKVLALAEKRAKPMSKYRTYYYEGIKARKSECIDKKGQKIVAKYVMFWGT